MASIPRTVADIFGDYCCRRRGLINALTHDVDTFFAQCDSDKDNLCLYGYPDGSWEVTLPSHEVPPVIPDPALGINFARNKMSRDEWLYLVAVHSDSWLFNVAFFYAAYLNKNQRTRLFSLINRLNNVVEDVKKWNTVQNTPRIDKSSEASGSKSRIPQKRSSDGPSKSTSKIVEDSHVESEEEQEETPCGRCGEVYQKNEFWIACDFCPLWYHGKCVNVTTTMADEIDKYECPLCAQKRNKA
ncbi:putative chromatin regulator PHD family [Helianthus annuus]|nr:putative chromatin regulator PHD family [Helianthus annuus]